MKVKARELMEEIENNAALKNADEDENQDEDDDIGESYEDMSKRIMQMALPKQEFVKDDYLEEGSGVYEYKPKY